LNDKFSRCGNVAERPHSPKRRGIETFTLQRKTKQKQKKKKKTKNNFFFFLFFQKWPSAPVDVFGAAHCAQLIPVHGLAGEWTDDNIVPLGVQSVGFYRDLVRAPDSLAAPCSGGQVRAVAGSFGASCAESSSSLSSSTPIDIVLIARELSRRGLPIECGNALQCSVNDVAVGSTGDGWALFLNDLLTAVRSAEESCGVDAHKSSVLVTPLDHFVALDGAEQRRAGVALVRALLSRAGGARVARAVVGLASSFAPHETANKHVKRTALAATTAIVGAEDYPLRAYVFHLLFWTVLMLIVVVLLAACVMHSLYGETEKDALLYRNTTSTMFANTLEMR
jgi:hypothetical protein